MTINKRKKNSRQRGSQTHGGGSMKKRRGSGHRGGVGMAGTGKRGDQKKPSIWKDPKYFGKFGFVSMSRAPETYGIDIKTIEDRIDTLLRQGKAKNEGGAIAINLEDLGYNKLLSTGNVTKKLIITTDFATEKAVAKIQKAGGEVKVLVVKKKKEEPKKKEEKA
jgi:large subunit ribosomal protein L15